MFIKLAYQSLLNRKGSVILTVLAMTVSIFVLLSVEHIRHQTKESFGNTVSGVDLIVGARTGSLNLLLYSVFRIGNPTNNIGWNAYQEIAANPNIEWAIPISLGDSHKGYRVMGTTADYFDRFRYGNKRALQFATGNAFSEILDVVLGAEVAKKLGYQLGDKLVLAHGIISTHFSLHDDKPFAVVGILEPTGTPVDQTLHVSLQGIEAIHVDWQQGVRMPGKSVSVAMLAQHDLTPKNITAFMLGLKSKIATFRVQRDINQYTKEPLMAILPGVALAELWQMMGILENTLRLISILVLIAALLGLSAMQLASVRERGHEVLLLRAIGASPLFLFLLVELEALLVSLVSVVLGASTLYITLSAMGDFLTAKFGLQISANIASEGNLELAILVILSTIVAAAIPAVSVYKNARLSQNY